MSLTFVRQTEVDEIRREELAVARGIRLSEELSKGKHKVWITFIAPERKNRGVGVLPTSLSFSANRGLPWLIPWGKFRICCVSESIYTFRGLFWLCGIGFVTSRMLKFQCLQAKAEHRLNRL